MGDPRREQRRNEHVEITMSRKDALVSDFDEVRFVHHSIPNIDVSQADMTSHIMKFDLAHPIYINAMTGGSNWARQISEKLAVVARETGVAMAVGSTHVASHNPSVIETFSIVREINPRGTIFSNVGADVPVDKALQAIELLDAQALQIHMNSLQELVMPEGNHEFASWVSNIESIVKCVDVPVIIKEVGFGISKETLQVLYDIGINYVDVSGRSGTDFVDIENERRSNKDTNCLSQWEQSTVESLLESIEFQDRLNIFTSGGLHTPLDAVKRLTLGARAIGMSRPFLNQVERSSITNIIGYVESFIQHMGKIMTVLDAPNIGRLRRADIVMSPELISWINQHGLHLDRK